MIFVNSRDSANFLINLFNKLSVKLQRHIDCRILTGGDTPEQRDKTIRDFRMNKFSALISTNLLARGLDVPEVDIVINYDIPFISDHFYKEPDYANYLHRVGRTGRFQTDGLAITLYQTEGDYGQLETSLLSKIEKYYEMKMLEISSIEEFMKIFYEMRP